MKQYTIDIYHVDETLPNNGEIVCIVGYSGAYVFYEKGNPNNTKPDWDGFYQLNHGEKCNTPKEWYRQLTYDIKGNIFISEREGK